MERISRVAQNADTVDEREDSQILRKIFDLIPSSNWLRYCVEVGARDGRETCITHFLTPNSNENDDDDKWFGVMIESDFDLFKELDYRHRPLGNRCLNLSLQDGSTRGGIVAILQQYASEIPGDYDLLSVNDGSYSYWILHDMWRVARYYPSIICVTFNESMPNELAYVPSRDERQNCASLASFIELALDNEYVPVAITQQRVFFAQIHLYDEYLQSEVPDTSIDTLHPKIRTHIDAFQRDQSHNPTSFSEKTALNPVDLTSITEHNARDPPPSDVVPVVIDDYQCSDDLDQQSKPQEHEPCNITANTLYKSLCSAEETKRHRSENSWPSRKIEQTREEEREHILHEQSLDPIPKRTFLPEAFAKGMAIDVSVLCVRKRKSDSEKRACALALKENLQKKGYVLIRGTGVSRFTCADALCAGNSFLQDTDESVRRSCLTENRVKTGYSPMCTESSGGTELKDMVRKFRVGVEMGNAVDDKNAWPSEELWDEDSIEYLRESLQEYYEVALRAVTAIINGIGDSENGVQRSAGIRSGQAQAVHASTLTVVGCRRGSRHIAQKSLVAPYKNDDILSMVIIDGGDCAIFQHKDEKGVWRDTTLPCILPDDPIFVLFGGDSLWNTRTHSASKSFRIVPTIGTVPMNYLMLSIRAEYETKLGMNTMIPSSKSTLNTVERAISPRRHPSPGSSPVPFEIDSQSEHSVADDQSHTVLQNRSGFASTSLDSFRTIPSSKTTPGLAKDSYIPDSLCDPVLFRGLEKSQRTQLIEQIIKLEHWRNNRLGDFNWGVAEFRAKLNNIAEDKAREFLSMGFSKSESNSFDYDKSPSDYIDLGTDGLLHKTQAVDQFNKLVDEVKSNNEDFLYRPNRVSSKFKLDHGTPRNTNKMPDSKLPFSNSCLDVDNFATKGRPGESSNVVKTTNVSTTSLTPTCIPHEKPNISTAMPTPEERLNEILDIASNEFFAHLKKSDHCKKKEEHQRAELNRHPGQGKTTAYADLVSGERRPRFRSPVGGRFMQQFYHSPKESKQYLLDSAEKQKERRESNYHVETSHRSRMDGAALKSQERPQVLRKPTIETDLRKTNNSTRIVPVNRRDELLSRTNVSTPTSRERKPRPGSPKRPIQLTRRHVKDYIQMADRHIKDLMRRPTGSIPVPVNRESRFGAPRRPLQSPGRHGNEFLSHSSLTASVSEKRQPRLGSPKRPIQIDYPMVPKLSIHSYARFDASKESKSTLFQEKAKTHLYELSKSRSEHSQAGNSFDDLLNVATSHSVAVSEQSNRDKEQADKFYKGVEASPLYSWDFGGNQKLSERTSVEKKLDPPAMMSSDQSMLAGGERIDLPKEYSGRGEINLFFDASPENSESDISTSLDYNYEPEVCEQNNNGTLGGYEYVGTSTSGNSCDELSGQKFASRRNDVDFASRATPKAKGGRVKGSWESSMDSSHRQNLTSNDTNYDGQDDRYAYSISPNDPPFDQEYQKREIHIQQSASTSMDERYESRTLPDKATSFSEKVNSLMLSSNDFKVTKDSTSDGLSSSPIATNQECSQECSETEPNMVNYPHKTNSQMITITRSGLVVSSSIEPGQESNLSSDLDHLLASSCEDSETSRVLDKYDLKDAPFVKRELSEDDENMLQHSPETVSNESGIIENSAPQESQSNWIGAYEVAYPQVHSSRSGYQRIQEAASNTGSSLAVAPVDNFGVPFAGARFVDGKHVRACLQGTQDIIFEHEHSPLRRGKDPGGDFETERVSSLCANEATACPPMACNDNWQKNHRASKPRDEVVTHLEAESREDSQAEEAYLSDKNSICSSYHLNTEGRDLEEALERHRTESPEGFVIRNSWISAKGKGAASVGSISEMTEEKKANCIGVWADENLGDLYSLRLGILGRRS